MNNDNNVKTEVLKFIKHRVQKCTNPRDVRRLLQGVVREIVRVYPWNFEDKSFYGYIAMQYLEGLSNKFPNSESVATTLKQEIDRAVKVSAMDVEKDENLL